MADMQTPETAMAGAFKAAGFVTSNERLRDIAVEAWARWSKPLESSDRMAFVREKLQGEITWHMMEQFAPLALRDAINALMRDTAELIAAQREKNRSGRNVAPGGGGQKTSENQSRLAPAAKPIPTAQADGRSEPADFSAKPIGKPPLAPSLKEMADRQAAAMAARAATMVRMSALDRVVINGQKIGDLTPNEAMEWARTYGIRVRFVEMIVSNLPPDRPIREFITPEEADKAYAAAEQAA